MKRALVNNIIPFSNVDGEGNRSAIFFQSCTLKCLFCHNPETINLCINCGKCVSTCPVQALSLLDGKVVWDKAKCINCDTCIKTCQNLSSPKTRLMSASDIMNEISSYIPYIRGITVSGGECMVWEEFLIELFTLAKEKGLSCLIDSNGTIDFENNKKLLDLSDGVMLDVKAYDNEFHNFMCKKNNDLILKNLHYLIKANKLYEVRTVLFPNFEDKNKETVKNVSKIIGPDIRYKLIKYRPYGVREEGIKNISDKEYKMDDALKMKEYAISNGALKATLI